jgi:hypothetical protein
MCRSLELFLDIPNKVYIHLKTDEASGSLSKKCGQRASPRPDLYREVISSETRQIDNGAGDPGIAEEMLPQRAPATGRGHRSAARNF